MHRVLRADARRVKRPQQRERRLQHAAGRAYIPVILPVQAAVFVQQIYEIPAQRPDRLRGAARLQLVAQMVPESKVLCVRRDAQDRIVVRIRSGSIPADRGKKRKRLKGGQHSGALLPLKQRVFLQLVFQIFVDLRGVHLQDLQRLKHFLREMLRLLYRNI